jgi:hypothetical protein
VPQIETPEWLPDCRGLERHKQRVVRLATNFFRAPLGRVRQKEEPILGQERRHNEGLEPVQQIWVPDARQNKGAKQDDDSNKSHLALEPGDASRKRHPAAGLTSSLRWLMLIAALLARQYAFAQDAAVKPNSSFTVPLPPPRPENPSESQGTSPFSPAVPSLAEPVPQQEAPRRLRYLPSASRARMHACGLEWQKLKETGSAADKTWFEFAQVCLAK